MASLSATTRCRPCSQQRAGRLVMCVVLCCDMDDGGRGSVAADLVYDGPGVPHRQLRLLLQQVLVLPVHTWGSHTWESMSFRLNDIIREVAGGQAGQAILASICCRG
jgi:hypothetical protein